MEEELLARETTDIWEDIGDMMEEEFEECSTATTAASAAASGDPEPDLEEARLRFQLKFDEKARQLEESKMLLEEATSTLKSLKHLKNNYDEDGEGDESEISCPEEQMKRVETEKLIKKGAEGKSQQLFKDSFLNGSSISFLNFDGSYLKSLERKTVDEKVPKDINKSKPQQ